jgi:hypothetical protein
MIFLFGIGFILSNIQRLGLDKLGGSDAFWVSLSWTGGTTTVLGVVGVIVYSIAAQDWIRAGVFVAFLVMPIAPAVNRMWRRYLFFFDPGRYAPLLEDDEIGNILGFWLDTFWRLPCQVAKTIISGNTGPRAGRITGF